MQNTKLNNFFDLNVLNYTQSELLELINELINENAPENKTLNDFTGGYIQQLKNSTRLTLFYGFKKENRNKATTQITIEDDEIDLVYIALKIKIADMKNKNDKIKKVSLIDKLNRKKLSFRKN